MYASNNDTLVEMGQRIRIARERAGVSIPALGAKINLQSFQVRALERGQYNLGISKLIDICRLLDCPLTSLMPD